MRFTITTLLFCGLVCAQPPQKPEPAKVPDDAVVATVDGKPLTAGQVRAILSALPAQGQQMYNVNPSAALQQYFVTMDLAEQAEKKGLDKQSPTRELLDFQRKAALAQVASNDFSKHIEIPLKDQQKYYADHIGQYEQAKVRVIYIAYSNGPSRSDVKVRTEAEAKARIEELRQQLVAGADFAKLAKESSDEKDTAEKGGEWGIVKRTSKFPEDVLKTIFSLKVGEISQPLKQPNGFYLLKVDEFSKQAYEDVAQQIYANMQQEIFSSWFQGIFKRFTVKLENTDFFPRTQPQPPGSH